MMGKILSPEDHSCFSALPPMRHPFMSKLWAVSMKNEARATTWSSNGLFWGLVGQKSADTNIYLWWVNAIYTFQDFFHLQICSCAIYRKNSPWCDSPLSNYNLPRFPDFSQYLLSCFAEYRVSPIAISVGGLEHKLLSFCPSPHLHTRDDRRQLQQGAWP